MISGSSCGRSTGCVLMARRKNHAMNPPTTPNDRLTTRRAFLKTSGAALAGAALTGATARPGYTAEEHTIKIALVGCGGRGTGAAANAMSTSGPTRLCAMADVFEDRLDISFKNLSKKLQH